MTYDCCLFYHTCRLESAENATQTQVINEKYFLRSQQEHISIPNNLAVSGCFAPQTTCFPQSGSKDAFKFNIEIEVPTKTVQTHTLVKHFEH